MAPILAANILMGAVTLTARAPLLEFGGHPVALVGSVVIGTAAYAGLVAVLCRDALREVIAVGRGVVRRKVAGFVA